MGTPAAKPGPKRPTGAKLGKYTLKEPLGQGAYGVVHVAEQKDGPNVAIKILDPSHARDEDAIERFKREGETAKRLDHPNIVRVLDVGSSRAKHYLVMELVRGGSLERVMRRDGSADKVLPALAGAAQALAYAHEQGVVHRDVKPANILLTKAGRAKVTDFGLARTVDHSSMTTEGRLLGTASYMSPEQVKGERATAASDVYAMGVMIYEAITGELPFKSDTQIGYLYQHAELAPPKPTVRAPYPSSLAEVALACLAKEPSDRPTMRQVAKRLGATALVRPPSWAWIALAAVTVLVVLAVVVATIAGY